MMTIIPFLFSRQATECMNRDRGTVPRVVQESRAKGLWHVHMEEKQIVKDMLLRLFPKKGLHLMQHEKRL
jgi:hypothetical protein